MSWYDMDSDIVHHLACDNPNCNSNHSGNGHEWKFQDEQHSWVINALRHSTFESPVTFEPKNDRDREFKNNLNDALRILKEEKGIEFEETSDGLGLLRKKKGIK